MARSRAPGAAMTSQVDSAESRFFNQVKRQPALIAALERNGFTDIKPYERALNPREGLTLEKADWMLPRQEGQLDTTRIVFKSIRRGDFRLCVQLDPHRLHHSLEDDPERQEAR